MEGLEAFMPIVYPKHSSLSSLVAIQPSYRAVLSTHQTVPDYLTPKKVVKPTSHRVLSEFSPSSWSFAKVRVGFHLTRSANHETNSQRTSPLSRLA